MTPTYGVDEFMQAAERQRAELTKQLDNVAQLRNQHTERRAEVQARADEAQKELLFALLPDLTPESIRRAVARTGYASLAQTNPQAQLAAETARLSARVKQLEADSRYRNRELLRAPHTGTLTQGLDELMEFRRAIVESMEGLSHPRLEHLLEVGYDTADYKVGWWRSAYYSDRKAAKEILSRASGKQRFREVREDYLQSREALVEYDQKIASLKGELSAGEALEREHDEAVAALSDVPGRLLSSLHEKLGKYLQDLEAPAIAERLKDEPDLQSLLKRWDGLRHKLGYLDELSQKQLDETEQKIRSEQQKLERDVMKYSRPKNQDARFPAGDFERRFQDRPRSFWTSINRYERSYDTVYGYDGYERASLVESFLWWDLMTDGRIHGRYISDVERHYQTYPHYHYERSMFDDRDDRRDRDDLAAAAVAGADGSLGPNQSLPGDGGLSDGLTSTPDAFTDIS